MNLEYRDQLTTIGQAFGLGDPKSFESASLKNPSVFKLTTDHGAYALKVVGADFAPDAAHLSSTYNEHKQLLRWELRMAKEGAPVAKPVMTTDGDSLYLHRDTPELFGGWAPFPRVVSVHEWVDGKHPNLDNYAQASASGHEIGGALARLHQRTLGVPRERTQTEAVDAWREGEMSWGSFEREIGVLAKQDPETAARIVHLLPKLKAMEAAPAAGATALTAVCHNDLTSNNVVMAADGPLFIDFDPEKVKVGNIANEVAQLDKFSLRDGSFRWSSPEAENAFVVSAIASYTDTLQVAGVSREELVRAICKPSLNKFRYGVAAGHPYIYEPMVARFETLAQTIDTPNRDRAQVSGAATQRTPTPVERRRPSDGVGIESPRSSSSGGSPDSLSRAVAALKETAHLQANDRQQSDRQSPVRRDGPGFTRDY